jgi:hypothetical protein
MMAERTHIEIEELLGAYSIDALDPDEQRLVEEHLPSCVRCRAEVADLREVAAMLAYTGGAAPEGVWDRIVASLDEAPPPMRLGVIPIERARSRRRRLSVAIGSVAAAILAVVAFQVRDSGSGGTTDYLREAALAALADPASTIAELRPPAGGDVVARVAVTQDGKGYLLGDHMAPLQGNIYELWGRTSDGTLLSLGVMERPGVYAFTVARDVEAVAVTTEDHPVDQPTSAPLVSGLLA